MLKVVAFVPVKLHSLRIPQKNCQKIAGRPLVWYLVDTLLRVQEIEKVYVYCSDPRVMGLVPEGATFLQRSESLDSDETKGEEIYDAFISEIDAEIYVLGHTTSPFLRAESVGIGLRNILDGKSDSAFSAQRLQTFVWYKKQPLNYSRFNIPRTQDIEPIFVETSGYYAFRREVWTDAHCRIGSRPFIQEVDSFEAIDIDEMKDLEFAQSVAEILLEKEGVSNERQENGFNCRSLRY